MNAKQNYKRQGNADFLAYMRRTGKAISLLPPAGFIRRFRYSIAETNWDRDLWGWEKWIDLSCWTVIASSLLFLISVTLSAFGK
jgi:hypothetical protein